MVSGVLPVSRTVRWRACPHGRSGWPQPGQPSLRRASAILAAAVSKTSIIAHPARIGPAVTPAPGAAGVAACHPAAARATRDGLPARYRHLTDAGTCRPHTGSQVTDTP